MLLQSLVFVLLSIYASAEEVHKKLCPNVDSSNCVVHSVTVDPCPHGPRFCSVFLGKRYNVNINFTPYFTAHDLMVSVLTVPEDGLSFTERTYKDACQKLLTCPLEAHVRQSFEVPLTLDERMDRRRSKPYCQFLKHSIDYKNKETFSNSKAYQSKFPVQIKLWNPEDESQVCCFSFKAKVK